jgi:ring-1,2-phenylacetyl-CoA epoxidase subunit PaaE
MKNNINAQIRIKLYFEDQNITIGMNETILQAAMRQRLQPPFSCQIGACGTCKAKLISGEVQMDEKEALTDDEIKQGYILTCQSHPISNEIYIDYDV